MTIICGGVVAVDGEIVDWLAANERRAAISAPKRQV
jgi:hypothetical protein